MKTEEILHLPTLKAVKVRLMNGMTRVGAIRWINTVIEKTKNANTSKENKE